MNRKLTLVTFVNILTIGILLWRLTENLSIIEQVDLNSTEHAEVIIKAGLLEQMGFDTNLITGITIGLLILNLFLFRQWMKFKKWILIPFFIFVLSLGLSFTYYFNLTNSIGDQLEKRKSQSIMNE